LKRNTFIFFRNLLDIDIDIYIDTSDTW
jgi:hypothetical protein